ncbi:MFS transporter [Mycolicibacterium gadium]|uniref:MFS transporter n=1 Tax=Mycolicibacterium gadium TaxID=1794 RepID=A0ABT6GWZ5_MYCGU|nr:MFS transporter [Mycolicibacterium gadium]MDG5486011.1 MFS transporter [Mycolicibacterium gadium]
MTRPDADIHGGRPAMAGLAATMTVVAMGLGYSITAGDPTILSANISEISTGMHMSPRTASFVASLATLTLAAAVLGAGALGDLYGMRRMFSAGLFGTIGFGVLAAAAPNVAVLIAARAGIGVAFAFLLGLSLALINSVFPPERRAAAIALYLGTGFALTTPMPALGSTLAEHVGWRSGFLVAPAAALAALAIVWRFVPETLRAPRRLDVAGLVLVAVALLALVYGISGLQGGPHTEAFVCIAAGLVAAVLFVVWETRTPEPALDVRVFRYARFNAAVTAGATFNFLTGGSTILFAFYLVTVRGDSPTTLGLLLVPATVLQALAAMGSGRAAARFGDRSTLVVGLLLLLAGLLVLTTLDETTSLPVLFVAIALIAVGGAVVQTPQSTIMMSSAPTDLGGSVSAVKAAVGQAGYSLGPALFALVGTALFTQDAMRRFAGSDISLAEAREALCVAHGTSVASTGGSNIVDPQRAREMVEGVTASMVDAIQTLSLAMTAVPVAAIVLALILLRPHTEQEL